MADDLRTRIKTIQYTHRLLSINEGYKCACGWQADPPSGWPSDYGGGETYKGHPGHVADALIRELAESGYAIVKMRMRAVDEPPETS